MWPELTIVTSCTGGYGKYLREWADSIIAQTMKPARIVIITHGSDDAIFGRVAFEYLKARLAPLCVTISWFHEPDRMDFGVARNCAVANADTEWVMHFDCDDMLYPTAVEDFQRLSYKADVVSAGYTMAGSHLPRSVQKRERLYRNATGRAALDLPSLASGISPFRRSFWEASPYRTDMVGAWDTALWIGFAKLGARFVATQRAAFKYRQHSDSIFNTRRRVNGWTRARTTAHLKALRRSYNGIAVIVPRDTLRDDERERIFQRVHAHYKTHHADWNFVVGMCPSPQWIKGAAVNDGLTRTKAEIIIIADADCIVDPDALQQSVDIVQNGAPWSMPHHMVYRADRQFTARVCDESADVLPGIPFEDACERRHEGALGGGIVVIQRTMYEAIGGIPLAFVGWGSEDRALGTIANKLLGPCVRGDADLLHLWHPQQSRTESAQNLHTLRSIGAAALRGCDDLVKLLSSLANTALPGVHKEDQRRMRSIAPFARTALSTPNQLQRRRIP